MEEKRKAVSVWLKPRHQRMLAEMPDISLPEITRKAIEEAFEARYDREYAKFCVQEDLTELEARWLRTLGLQTTYTITATEDGFRIVLVSLKNYGDVVSKPEPKQAPVSVPAEINELEDTLDEFDA